MQILFQKDGDLFSNRESIVMITKDNEKYRCILPQEESKQEVLSGFFNILTLNTDNLTAYLLTRQSFNLSVLHWRVGTIQKTTRDTQD